MAQAQKTERYPAKTYINPKTWIVVIQKRFCQEYNGPGKIN